MTSQVDVHDLPEEDVKRVENFVERLRMKKQAQKTQDNNIDEEEMKSWPLGVKGNLSRKEIYDYL